MNDMARIFDVFFNGRPADGNQSAVTIKELIQRGTSLVLVDGTLYRIVVTKAEVKEEAGGN